MRLAEARDAGGQQPLKDYSTRLRANAPTRATKDANARWASGAHHLVAMPVGLAAMAGPRLSPFPETTAGGRAAPAAVGATPVVEVGGLALPHLQGALRFAAHDDHKIGILASLDAKALV